MRTSGHIAFALILLSAPASGAGQERGGVRPPQGVEIPIIGSPAEIFPQRVEPLSGSIEWLREEVDPIQRARRQIRQMRYQRANQRALEAAAGAARSAKPRDPSVEWADWRFSIGNNGSWSPYPDRELDARNIRFPLRMKTDNRSEADKALERMRKTKGK